MSAQALHVVAGVLVDPSGRVLIAQRPAGKHLAGGWEFPGGKLDAGEAREAGLRRELREELGIEVGACRPLIRLHHRYPERDVDLDVWRVDGFSGEPQSLDAQALRWCAPGELAGAQLLPADVPVITALRLPQRLQDSLGEDFRLLPAARFAARPHDSRLAGAACTRIDEAMAAVQQGADFIAFLKTLPDEQLAAACTRLQRPVFASGVDERHAWDAGAVGICLLPD